MAHTFDQERSKSSMMCMWSMLCTNAKVYCSGAVKQTTLETSVSTYVQAFIDMNMLNQAFTCGVCCWQQTAGKVWASQIAVSSSKGAATEAEIAHHNCHQALARSQSCTEHM
jgi:hypothetical protein